MKTEGETRERWPGVRRLRPLNENLTPKPCTLKNIIFRGKKEPTVLQSSVK